MRPSIPATKWVQYTNTRLKNIEQFDEFFNALPNTYITWHISQIESFAIEKCQRDVINSANEQINIIMITQITGNAFKLYSTHRYVYNLRLILKERVHHIID